MYENNADGRNQGDDYHHSTFMDLIITGLFGVRPDADSTMLTVNPQFPAETTFFCLDGLKYVTLMTRPLRWFFLLKREVDAPHLCPLGPVAKATSFMLTCGFTFR